MLGVQVCYNMFCFLAFYRTKMKDMPYSQKKKKNSDLFLVISHYQFLHLQPSLSFEHRIQIMLSDAIW